MPETEVPDGPAFGLDLFDGERQSRDRIFGIEAAIGTAVHAHVGEIERGEQTDHLSESAASQAVSPLRHFFEKRSRGGGEQTDQRVQVHRLSSERPFHVRPRPVVQVTVDIRPLVPFYLIIEAHFHITSEIR